MPCLTTEVKKKHIQADPLISGEFGTCAQPGKHTQVHRPLHPTNLHQQK